MEANEVIARGLVKRNAERALKQLEFVKHGQIAETFDELDDTSKQNYLKEANDIMVDLAMAGFFVKRGN